MKTLVCGTGKRRDQNIPIIEQGAEPLQDALSMGFFLSHGSSR
jgi:hypothetical protein